MNILIVDDHALFREGMKLLLQSLSADLHVLEASSCKEAVAVAGELAFDLILLDLQFPDQSGLQALTEVKESFPTTAIVVLSGEEDARVVRACIDAGAMGFIPKSSSSEILIHALNLVLAKGIYLPPKVLDTLRSPDAAPSAADSAAANALPDSPLSERQVDVLSRAIQGKPNKIIARELDLSEATVKAHLSAIYRTLGVRNRTEAVFAAAKLGLKIG